MVMAQAQNPTLRKTLIKHMIGKVRTSHYLLPEDHFVFGIANKLDREGAAQGNYYLFENDIPMFGISR
jgi:hypothetical protein